MITRIYLEPLTQECSDRLNGFCYLKIKESITLPHGFFGTILFNVESPKMFDDVKINNSISTHIHVNNAIQITRVVLSDFRSRSYTTWVSMSENFHFVTSARFIVINENIEKTGQRRTYESKQDLQYRLADEVKSYSDMLLIPDHVDVYANLPSKLFKSIELIHEQHPRAAILKCDDDSYVDLRKVYSNLMNDHNHFHHNDNRIWWWGK